VPAARVERRGRAGRGKRRGRGPLRATLAGMAVGKVNLKLPGVGRSLVRVCPR